MDRSAVSLKCVWKHGDTEDGALGAEQSRGLQGTEDPSVRTAMRQLWAVSQRNAGGLHWEMSQIFPHPDYTNIGPQFVYTRTSKDALNLAFVMEMVLNGKHGHGQRHNSEAPISLGEKCSDTGNFRF